MMSLKKETIFFEQQLFIRAESEFIVPTERKDFCCVRKKKKTFSFEPENTLLLYFFFTLALSYWYKQLNYFTNESRDFLWEIMSDLLNIRSFECFDLLLGRKKKKRMKFTLPNAPIERYRRVMDVKDPLCFGLFQELPLISFYKFIRAEVFSGFAREMIDLLQKRNGNFSDTIQFNVQPVYS